ncbi:MAG: hypothetical protein O2999_07445 [Nitrospirae bacterium]|nr:hypothetical protein [Nitrospirota bacterium]MDA1304119.1 hypothetical protein [Nitrospirota bacterium]
MLNNNKNMKYGINYKMQVLWILVGVVVFIGHACGQPAPGFAPQEAKKEMSAPAASHQRIMALDQKNWKRPQSSFNWVAMARGVKTPWDSHGRSGWMTDDAYVEPIDPGASEFSPETDLFYIVFSVSGMDAPSQFRAAWYFMPDGKTPAKEHSGTDALFLEMNEKAGYLEIFRPEGGWKKGKYLLRLFYESPGQELYDGNIVGTMVFTITDTPAA